MYRGEIQNDSIGGSLHRSLDFSPSNSGGGGDDRFESRNLSFSAALRGGREYPLESESDDDDGNDSELELEGGSVPTNPALYEKAKSIVYPKFKKPSAYRSGALVKKYKEMGGEYKDEPGGKRPLERWFKEDWKNVGKDTDYPTYRPTKRITKDTPLTADEIDPQNLSEQIKRKQKIKGEKNLRPFVGKGKPFTNKQLTKIILDKNEVIADLEENAYGGRCWDGYEARGVKMKNGKMVPNCMKIGGAIGGAAATKPETKPSAVSAVAAVLKPAREAIQNGIGDALYGAETDPRKQKKGLLGISEEGKEESQKKVMKNIVVPLAKVGTEVAKGYKNAWNSLFNKDQFDADDKADKLREFRKLEKEAGVVRNKEGVIVKAPRYYDPNRPEGYIFKDGVASGIDTEFFKKQPSYIRIPNPIKAAGLRPSSRELELDDIKLWEPQSGDKGKIGKTLKDIQNDEFIFAPEADAKKIYGELRGFVEQEKGKELATGFEELGYTKGEMRDFAKLGADFKSFTPQEKRDYLQEKNLIEKQQLKNASEKVDRDIKDEEAKKVRTEIRGERPVEVGAPPDQAKLAKMREAKVKIAKLQESKQKEAQRQFKMDAEAMEIEKQQSDIQYYKNLKNTVAAPEVLPGEAPEASPYEQEESDNMAEFKALSPAERSLQLDAYRKELQKLGYSEEQIQEAVGAVGGAMVGGGAIEFALARAGKALFNPTGNMTMAGKQTFSPDYDAYGATVAGGRLNAFNLSRSMYDQSKSIELPDFELISDKTSIRFYLKDNEDVILMGIRGTDYKSYTDLYTWAVIGAKQNFGMTKRFKDDLQKLLDFQRDYPIEQYYYVATGSSLAGNIADQFLSMGLIEEALTYNPAIEQRFILDGDIRNHRVYLDTDPLFILMGQYAPNTEIRVNPNKENYYNPIKEKDYLVASHSIYPVYNTAFEGGGMEGSGKTYTIEEWKAIFDAKLEEKRKAIEARESKKKQTAKAKRDRAKAVRDARKQEPEEEESEVEITEYEMGDETYLVEDAREGLAFDKRRVFTDDNEEIGFLTVDDVGKTLVKMVMAREKPKAKKPRLKIVSPAIAKAMTTFEPKTKSAPASARVELREELVAEQSRSPAGKFAAEKTR